jgi:hypothetical protein
VKHRAGAAVVSAMSNDFWEGAKAHARVVQERMRSSADATHEQTNTALDELQKTLWAGAGAAKKGVTAARPFVLQWLERIGIRFN